MLEHYRGSFGKDEGLVLEEYRRARIEIKADTIDSNSIIHKWMEEKAKQRAEGMVLLKNSDTRSFSVLLVDLENNFSWRVNQYPEDMTESYNLLVKHKSPPDNNNKSRRNRIRERRRPDNQEGKNILAQDTVEFHHGITCYNCGEEGHYAGNCPHLDKRNGKGNVDVQLVNQEKESDEEDDGMEIGFLNTAIQFESDNSVSTSSSESSGDLPPLVFRSDSSNYDSLDDNSTDTGESSSTSSYSDEEMPPLFNRSNSYDSDSSDEDTIESEDTNKMPPLLSRSNLYDSDSSDEDTIELGNFSVDCHEMIKMREKQC